MKSEGIYSGQIQDQPPLSPHVTSYPPTAEDRRQQPYPYYEAIQSIAEYGKNVKLALDEHSRDIRSSYDQILEQNHRIEEHSEFLLTLHHVQLNTQADVARLGQDVRETRAEMREVKRQLARIEEFQRQQSEARAAAHYGRARSSKPGTKRCKLH